MKEFERLGFTSKLTNETFTIEISIDNLINAFELCPNNYYEDKVKKDKKQMFAEFIAQQILNECDSETGDTHISKAFDSVFDLLIEGYEDGSEFIESREGEY